MPACALSDNDQRLVVNPIIEGVQRVMTMNLDGSDQVEVTGPNDGFTYGVSVSPDGQRLAFHATGAGGYRIFTTRLDGSDRREIAGGEGHLYFGPNWSHDGQWLLYLDCHTSGGPGHDWADLAIGRPDGSEHRVVTVSVTGSAPRSADPTHAAAARTYRSGRRAKTFARLPVRCHDRARPGSTPATAPTRTTSTASTVSIIVRVRCGIDLNPSRPKSTRRLNRFPLQFKVK